MKMITAIINRKDANAVCTALTDAKVAFTKVASSGGFLKTGNETLLIGADDERVKEIISIIRENSAKRMEPTADMVIPGNENFGLKEVLVGGATVFVSEVSYYEKM